MSDAMVRLEEARQQRRRARDRWLRDVLCPELDDILEMASQDLIEAQRGLALANAGIVTRCQCGCDRVMTERCGDELRSVTCLACRAELVLNEVTRVALLRLLMAKEAGRDAG